MPSPFIAWRRSWHIGKSTREYHRSTDSHKDAALLDDTSPPTPDHAAPFPIGKTEVEPGEQAELELPIARLPSGNRIGIPLLAFHGASPGPALWLTAAIHGDEIGGVEIIRRVVAELDPSEMAGTVIAAPVVNVHGFIGGDRYLPDRRDLNRSFPGSRSGSLAARVAKIVMTEIVARCAVGIDLHTGSDHRTNLPQIRADLNDPRTAELTDAFAPAVAIHARTRDGSLRQAATDAGNTVLLYEAGEAYRFDEPAIATGTAGVLRVLAHLGICQGVETSAEPPPRSFKTRWIRATASGILHMDAALGDRLTRRQVIASIYDAFGERRRQIKAPFAGMVIGHTQHPLVNQGDAVLHIAQL